MNALHAIVWLAALVTPAFLAWGAFLLWLSELPTPPKIFSRLLAASVAMLFAECIMIIMAVAIRINE